MSKIDFALARPIGVVVFSVWLAGCGPAVISAEKFILVDKDGKARAILEVSNEGPSLRLLDRNGTDRAVLSAADGGSGLVLKDKSMKDRVMLVGSNESSGLILSDREGKEQAGLRAREDASSLTLGDIQGQKMDGAFASLTAKAEGPFLFFRSKDGTRRMTVKEGK